jgi:hypothetical protein
MSTGRLRFGPEAEAPAPFGTSCAFHLTPEGPIRGCQVGRESRSAADWNMGMFQMPMSGG